MKTIEINVYEYNELSEKAQIRALIDYQADKEYSLSYPSIRSLEAFMDAVGVRMISYDIDWLMPNLCKVIYKGTPNNNDIEMHFTNSFTDEVISDNWNDCKSIERTLKFFFEDASLGYEYELSEEYFVNYCCDNKILFYESGKQLTK